MKQSISFTAPYMYKIVEMLFILYLYTKERTEMRVGLSIK